MDDSIRGENILLNDSSLTLACSHTEPYCAACNLTISKWVSAQYVETRKRSQGSTSILNSEHHNFLQLTVNSPPARSFSFPALSLAQHRRVIDDCVNPWEERSFPQNTANIGQHRLTMTMTATMILRLSNLADEMPGKNFSDCGIVT